MGPHPPTDQELSVTPQHHTDASSYSLVTGVTGFVGGQLAKTLLTTSDRNLICPVRANSADHANERGANRLVELFGDQAIDVAHRIEWVRGDLEETHLGWATNQFANIARRIGEVFHCAASVEFDLPLDEARRINVDGTINVFEVARAAHAATGRFRRFHHVSTAYVAGTRKGVVQADYLPAARASNFRNTYEQSKAEAERWLRTQASVDLPVSIHRPSIVGGSTTTGATDNWNVLYVPMKLAARGMLPAFTRGGRELCDSVGVDFVVEAIAVFAELDTKPLACHHLTAGETVFTITDLIRVTETRAKGAGMKPSTASLMHPKRMQASLAALKLCAHAPQRFGSLRRKGARAARAASSVSVYVPYTSVNVEYDTKDDHELLAAHGVAMPTGHVYLATIVDYALATDFGKRALQPEPLVVVEPEHVVAPQADLALVGA